MTDDQTSNSLPLSGIRVVDLTRVMTGPFCTMMLGDMGADVVKIEMPGKGDDTREWGPPFVAGESTYFLSVNRNKRSVVLDLKSDAGAAALWRLIEGADVLVENFSPGTIGRLGFGYEEVRKLNPRIVYASISGFGQTGPAANRAAYDLIVQGISGLMSVTGDSDGSPVKVGPPIADIVAGMFAAFAISSSLYGREQTGEGQFIDVSMLGGQVAILSYLATMYLNTGRTPLRRGNSHAVVTPYGMFPTADGFVNIAVGNESLWRRFCEAVGIPELLEDERFSSNALRHEHIEPLNRAINSALAKLTTAEVVARLDACAVPCGPIYTVAQLFEDPQLDGIDLAQQMAHPKVGSLRLPGLPYHLAGHDNDPRLAPPLLGEHTREVLTEIGMSEEDIAALT